MYVTGFCHKEPRCCVAVYLQICVCGLSVHSCDKGIVRLWYHQSIQERNGPIRSYFFCCELDVWVQTISVFKEFLFL